VPEGGRGRKGRKEEWRSEGKRPVAEKARKATERAGPQARIPQINCPGLQPGDPD